MNPEKLKELLVKVPWAMIAAVYLAYLGWDLYSFSSDPTSPLGAKVAAVDSETKEIDKVKLKIAEAEDFKRKLEEKRLTLADEVRSLETTRATLSDTLDVPSFMNMVYTEAKRMGLQVTSMKPTESAEREYYAEQAFDMTFRGVFIQLVGFLDRVANLQRIVRVENFSIKPLNSSATRFVELEGVVQLKVYRYLGSAADRIDATGTKKAGDAKAGGAAVPATAAKRASGGA